MKNTTRTIALLTFAALTLTGCQNGINRILWGPDSAPEVKNTSHLITVSCCRDAGQSTYPAFVPTAHAEFCEDVRQATRNNQLINGNTYLAMGVDCGHGHHDIGDEYYPPTGY